ncbi:MAG: outer membrane beta-barrel protein [Sulfuricaulis sp.]
MKASGITESGYIDYSYIDRSIDQSSLTYRNYDTERHGFSLQMTDLSIGYLPTSGFGGFAELNYGSDAKGDSGAADPSTAKSNTDVQQVYMQYASGLFSVMAGKYDTPADAEVVQAPSNTIFSCSLLFILAEPTFHTGVRAAYAPSDTTKFTVGINNGWNVNEKSYKTPVGTPAKYPTGNTVELGVSVAPVKILSLPARTIQAKRIVARAGARGRCPVATGRPSCSASSLSFRGDPSFHHLSSRPGTGAPRVTH